MSSNTVPVPGLFEQQILTNEFVELDNLLPVNLSNGACVQNLVASGVKKPKISFQLVVFATGLMPGLCMLGL